MRARKLIFVFSFFIFLGVFSVARHVRANHLVLSFNITVNESTSSADGSFNFHITSGNPIEDFSKDFSIQTSAGSGSNVTNAFSGSGDTVVIAQDSLTGWQDPNISCSSADPSIIFTYVDGGVNMNSAPFDSVTCNFTNTQQAVKTPVLIVPGVLGTEISKPTDSGLETLWLDLASNFLSNSDDFMDPLQFNADLTPSDTTLTIGDVIGKVLNFDYSQGLMTEFENQGYTENTDLFLFPYDWRYGVSDDTVTQLKQKIADILAQTGASKVDVVAHSTGGLIVKKYVIENPGDNDIDKAVFVGVPNTGAPKAVKALIEGDDFDNYLVSDSEMQKISANLPVAYDLLPSEQYFSNAGSFVKVINENGFTNTSTDLDFEQANNFLTQDHNLNSQALDNAVSLHTTDFDNYDMRTAGVDLYAIDGCKAGTISKFVETRSQNILTGGSEIISYSLEDAPGDGTVPFESSTNLPINDANKFYALEGEHGGMLSDIGIRQEIVNIISGTTLSTQDSKGHDVITQDISQCHLNGRAISIFSPLSIDVVDQDGNHSGFLSDGSIENNIPNADFEIVGDHKFVYLPTDDGQTYTISVAGTGTGTFTITDATIADNSVTQTQVFSDISVTPSLLGHIDLSNNTDTTLTLDTDGDGTTDQTLQPNSVLDASQSEDFVPDQENNTPPTQNNTAVGSAPLVTTPPPVTNTPLITQTVLPVQPSAPVVPTPVLVALSMPPEIPAVKQESVPVVVTPTKKTQKSKPKLIATPIVNAPTENTLPLSASVIDSNTHISYKGIVSGFAGFVYDIFSLAKRLIKL